MDYFVSWIKGVAIFYIIAALILNIVPNEKNKKYIRFFLGIVMIIMLVKPIGKIFGVDDDFFEYFNIESNKVMSKELKEKLYNAEEYRKQEVAADYTGQIKDSIKEYIESLGWYYIDSDIEIDTDENSAGFGTIKMISVDISKEKAEEIHIDKVTLKRNNSEEELISIEIKKYLANFYNLDKRNIYVNIA